MLYNMPLRPYDLAATLVRNKPVQVPIRCFSKFDAYGNSPIPSNKQRFVPTSGTYPRGFLLRSTNIGLKPPGKSQPDLILVASEKPSCGAAVFTKNEFPAASITVSKDIVERSKGWGIRGIIANSGCANTLTGIKGREDAVRMSREAGRLIDGEMGGEGESSVMVMHTGAGGQRLPINEIINNIPNLIDGMGNSHEHWLQAAKGICTTDTFPKLASRTFTLPSSPSTIFSIAGITKGAGMIHPNMATTLGIICTDAPVTPLALQQLLSTAADKSYNCISVEGDTSTNDMLAMLANGAAAAPPHDEIDFHPSSASQSDDFVAFQRMLIAFTANLAKLVVRDGEGASKFITIRVRGSPSYPAAKHIASVIARSVLFKTGTYGKDANWGGVLAAAGYALIDTEFAGKGIVVPELTSVTFVPGDGGAGLKFLDKGLPVEVDESRVKVVMEQEDVEVVVDLRDGNDDAQGGGGVVEEAVYWTCDLTHEFVTMNGDFRR